jgi:hypothetical protein
MNTREELSAAVQTTYEAYRNAQEALLEFEMLAINNVFPTIEDASMSIEDKLYRNASADCEGAYNCGELEYQQEFMVDNVTYVGIFTPEYDRYDKTYYYIKSSKFRYEVIE